MLLVVAAIAILAGVVIIAINPARQLAEVRNTERRSDARTILDALYQYSLDNSGSLPAGISEELHMIGTAADGCAVTCGTDSGPTGPFVDDTQEEADAGTYFDTGYDPTGWIELDSSGLANGSGVYTSSIKDTSVASSWDTLSWTSTIPTSRALPDDKAGEPLYPRGANMTGNLLLYHFDETSGGTCSGGSDLCDTSGEDAHADLTGAAYGAGGRFDNAIDLDGYGDHAAAPSAPAIPSQSSFTYALWVRIDSTQTGSMSDGSGDYILDRMNPGNPLISIKEVTGNQFGYQTRYDDGTGLGGPVGGTIRTGTWQHIAIVREYGQFFRLYVDGVNVASTADNGRAITTPVPRIGCHATAADGSVDGRIDEFSAWGRALTAPEVQNLYSRGAAHLRFKVRSCDDAACSGESFIGPDGTINTSYDDTAFTATSTTPSFALSNLIEDRYFQYRALLETDNGSFSPELTSVSLAYTKLAAGGEETADACLDLSSLAPDHLVALPEDPSDGSTERTYYAVKRTANGRLNVQACSSEIEETISITR